MTIPMAALPAWVQDIHPHQLWAVRQIVKAFETHDVVFLDGPTGTGKTLIAELVRRELIRTGQAKNGLYVCNNKELQDQFVRDFQYADLLKGRANYRTQLDSGKTCDDCTVINIGDACWYCNSKGECPYEQAKARALSSDLAVINSSYFLTEANYVGGFSDRDFVIIDEADTTEQQLMGFVEYRLPQWLFKELRLSEPAKGLRKKKLVEWLHSTAVEIESWLQKNQGQLEPKRIRAVKGYIADTRQIAADIELEIERREQEKLTGEASDDDGLWLRIYEEGKQPTPILMRPVMVNTFGQKYLWRHGKKWLIMSATLISPDELADSLGLQKDWKLVSVPMMFPVENRPIIATPIGSCSFKTRDETIPKMVDAIKRICTAYPDDRILVHSVSYWLTNELHKRLTGPTGLNRVVLKYDEAKGKENALKAYKKSKNAVMLAPSMERGTDLRDDLCRVMIVAKMPFPSLGDRTISARIHLPGGQIWYNVQTIRNLVQMTGRGVRSVDDWAVTYILDSDFIDLYRKNQSLFPEWWRDSVNLRADVRWIYGIPTAPINTFIPTTQQLVQ